MDWVAVKDWISNTSLEKDALHVYGAVTIQIVAAIVSGRGLGSLFPWACVLLLEILNETLDLRWGETTRIEVWQIAGAIHDLVNTMLLPTALLLLVRYFPQIFRWEYNRPNRGEPETGAGRSGEEF